MPEERIIKKDTGKHRHRRRKGGSHEKVILIGNPNVGKSVIFGLLTGKYVTVSNYPGTTVEVTYGNISLGDTRYTLIDSPGVNNLTPMSEDEKVTRDILLKERPASVILTADAKNLKRALMLLVQLSEMELPCILDLNMEDEAKARGIEIDYDKLRDILGIEVVGTVAPQRLGISRLKDAILKPRAPSVEIKYHPVIEEYAERISAVLPAAPIASRAIALMILSGDESLKDWLVTNLSEVNIKNIEDLRDEAFSKLRSPVSYEINNTSIRF